jgi:predicted amidohydrolase
MRATRGSAALRWGRFQARVGRSFRISPDGSVTFELPPAEVLTAEVNRERVGHHGQASEG